MAKQNGKQVEKTYVFREEVKDNDDDEKPSESIMAGLKKPRMRRIIINLCYQVKFSFFKNQNVQRVFIF